MKELGWKPYRLQLLHALKEGDPDRRCEFAEILLNSMAADSSFLGRLIWIDEAVFKLNSHGNRHNCVYHAVIGPFFFSENILADS